MSDVLSFFFFFFFLYSSSFCTSVLLVTSLVVVVFSDVSGGSFPLNIGTTTVFPSSFTDTNLSPSGLMKNTGDDFL